METSLRSEENVGEQLQGVVRHGPHCEEPKDAMESADDKSQIQVIGTEVVPGSHLTAPFQACSSKASFRLSGYPDSNGSIDRDQLSDSKDSSLRRSSNDRPAVNIGRVQAEPSTAPSTPVKLANELLDLPPHQESQQIAPKDLSQQSVCAHPNTVSPGHTDNSRLLSSVSCFDDHEDCDRPKDGFFFQTQLELSSIRSRNSDCCASGPNRCPSDVPLVGDSVPPAQPVTTQGMPPNLYERTRSERRLGRYFRRSTQIAGTKRTYPSKGAIHNDPRHVEILVAILQLVLLVFGFCLFIFFIWSVFSRFRRGN